MNKDSDRALLRDADEFVDGNFYGPPRRNVRAKSLRWLTPRFILALGLTGTCLILLLNIFPFSALQQSATSSETGAQLAPMYVLRRSAYVIDTRRVCFIFTIAEFRLKPALNICICSF